MSNLTGAATVPTQSLKSTPVTILYKLSNPFTSPLSVPKGGTGIGSFSKGDILYGASSILTTLPLGSNGQVLSNDSTKPTWDNSLNNIKTSLTTIQNQQTFATGSFTQLANDASSYFDRLTAVNDVITNEVTTVNGLITQSSNQDQKILNEKNELQTLQTSLVGVDTLSAAVEAEDAKVTALETKLSNINTQLISVNTDILQAQDNINHLSSNINSFGLYKNKIMNGGFTIWQRSEYFSGNLPLTGYAFPTADRWQLLAGATVICVMQKTTGVIGHNRVANALHLSFAGAGNKTLRHNIENVRTLQGQQCTISFWAKGPAFTLNLVIKQVLTSSNSVTVVTTTFNITEDYQQFSYTFNMPVIAANATISPNNYIQINFSSSLNWSVDIANIQLEQGPMSTFEFRPESYELMLCQKFYETGYAYFLGYAFQSTTPFVNCSFKVPKRAIPNITSSVINTSSFTSTVVNGQVTTQQLALGCTKNTYSTDGSFNIKWIADSELI